MLLFSDEGRLIVGTHRIRALSTFFLLLSFAAIHASAQEDEIVANLAGGRIIIHVASDGIVFAAIDHPLEAKSVPPRVAAIGSSHVGIFFGASEWQVPAQPQPIRLDRDISDIRPGNPHDTYRPPGSGEADLEVIGTGFLEKLRPLVSQLHHKIELKPDEPLVEIVLIGYAPQAYGPEVWLIDYRAEQESVGATGDFWQTHILRPSFNQIYPPEKHQAKTIVEVRFPDSLEAIPLVGLIQANDPRMAQVRSSEPRFNKVAGLIEKGQANKALMEEAGDFLRAALPFVAGNAHFVEGEVGESGGFQWIVPPDEPREKAKRGEDKDRPADAPTLMRKPNPNR
jgi:hypothetical protein